MMLEGLLLSLQVVNGSINCRGRAFSSEDSGYDVLVAQYRAEEKNEVILCRQTVHWISPDDNFPGFQAVVGQFTSDFCFQKGGLWMVINMFWR